MSWLCGLANGDDLTIVQGAYGRRLVGGAQDLRTTLIQCMLSVC